MLYSSKIAQHLHLYLILLMYKFIDGSVTVWVTKGEIIYLHVDGSLKDNVLASSVQAVGLVVAEFVPPPPTSNILNSSAFAVQKCIRHL